MDISTLSYSEILKEIKDGSPYKKAHLEQNTPKKFQVTCKYFVAAIANKNNPKPPMSSVKNSLKKCRSFKDVLVNSKGMLNN